jgi:mannose-6-phosphate isomerase-like protein (cupin superfamily)
VLDQNAGVTEPGDGEVLDVFGGLMVVKADPALRGLFFGEHVIPPGYGVPLHVHAGDDELFFLLEGELTILSAAGEQRIGPGTTVQLPGGSRHGFRNDTAETVRFLVVVRPGLQALEMWRHFDRAGRTMPNGLTPPEIVAICAQYGVEMG